MQYVIGIDQSTQGTKALLLDEKGTLLLRRDLPHRQIISEQGWVSHDPEEIYHNTVKAVQNLVEKSGIDTAQIAAVGISNQRETTAIWDRKTGKPLAPAVVWQCDRARGIVDEVEKAGYGEYVRKTTGIPLSAYFPAAKMAWLLRDCRERGAVRESDEQEICLGTMDSWLIFKLTGGRVFKTDYSNASRTQLFSLETLSWDEELCRIFGIPLSSLAQVCDSDACYGYTDLEGIFKKPVPICGVLGDSHAALFGQGCGEPGTTKATYGTGSSLMMNVGEQPVYSEHGIVSSLAWCRQGKVNYVLEGNLNYTGAVITWMKDDLKLISSAAETESLAFSANTQDKTVLVPAFTGLGAPYWEEKASAAIVGMTRTTKRAELVRAGLECIAFQITDLVSAMELDTGFPIRELRADGGPTKNRYLMQFQSDIADKAVEVSAVEEASGIGAAYLAGITAGVYHEEELFERLERQRYVPSMEEQERTEKREAWNHAIKSVRAAAAGM